MVEKSTEEEDFQEAARSTADYAEYEPPKKQRNPVWRKMGRRIGIGAAALLLIAALGAGGYWFYKNRQPASNTDQASQSEQNPAPSTAKITTETQHHDSANFNLGFDYPGNWTVSDEGGGILTVRSPAISLNDANGQAASVQITMTIRQTDQELSEFETGSAVAVLDSERVAYVNPTENQRANTFLTFLRFADSAAGFDGIYITGDNGYKQDQEVPKAEVQAVDPIISVTFAECSNGQCGGETSPLSISLENWDDDGFAQPLKAMLQSLTIN